MRSYPTNSPQAAGRILALMLIADGNVCTSEIGALIQQGAEPRLGLADGSLGVLLRDLCEDLMLGGYHGGALSGFLDDDSLRSMMAELTHPPLQAEVMALAHAAAGSDTHLAEGEAFILDAARRHWPAAAALQAAAAA
jgi:hypothetical protein